MEKITFVTDDGGKEEFYVESHGGKTLLNAEASRLWKQKKSRGKGISLYYYG